MYTPWLSVGNLTPASLVNHASKFSSNGSGLLPPPMAPPQPVNTTTASNAIASVSVFSNICTATISLVVSRILAMVLIASFVLLT